MNVKKNRKYKPVSRQELALFARRADLSVSAEEFFEDIDLESPPATSFETLFDGNKKWLVKPLPKAPEDDSVLDIADPPELQRARAETLNETIAKQFHGSKRLQGFIPPLQADAHAVYPPPTKIYTVDVLDYMLLEPCFADPVLDAALDELPDAAHAYKLADHLETKEESILRVSSQDLEDALVIDESSIVKPLLPSTPVRYFEKIEHKPADLSLRLDTPLLQCDTPPSVNIDKIPDLLDPPPGLLASLESGSDLGDETLSVNEDTLIKIDVGERGYSQQATDLYHEIYPQREHQFDSPIEQYEDREHTIISFDNMVFGDLASESRELEQLYSSKDSAPALPIVDPNVLEENIQELTIHQLPLPIVSEIGIARGHGGGREAAVKLPEFVYPEWSLPYFVLYKLNWKPFANVAVRNTEEMIEFEKVAAVSIRSPSLYEDVFGQLEQIGRRLEEFSIGEDPTADLVHDLNLTATLENRLTGDSNMSPARLEKLQSPGYLVSKPSTVPPSKRAPLPSSAKDKGKGKSNPKPGNWDFLEMSSDEEESGKIPSKILTSSILEYSAGQKRMRSPSSDLEIIEQVPKKVQGTSAKDDDALFYGEQPEVSFEDGQAEKANQSIRLDVFRNSILNNQDFTEPHHKEKASDEAFLMNTLDSDDDSLDWEEIDQLFKGPERRPPSAGPAQNVLEGLEGLSDVSLSWSPSEERAPPVKPPQQETINPAIEESDSDDFVEKQWKAFSQAHDVAPTNTSAPAGKIDSFEEAFGDFDGDDDEDDFAALSKLASAKRSAASNSSGIKKAPTHMDGLISFSPYFTQAIVSAPSKPVVTKSAAPAAMAPPEPKKIQALPLPTARGLQNHFSFSINSSLQTTQAGQSMVLPPQQTAASGSGGQKMNTSLDMYFEPKPQNAEGSVGSSDAPKLVIWKKLNKESSTREPQMVLNIGSMSLAHIQQFQRHSGSQLIEANLGEDAAHIYLSHKACVVFMTLESLQQRSVRRAPAVARALARAGLSGDVGAAVRGVEMMAFERLVKLNVTVDLVFCVLVVERLAVSGAELARMQQLQAALAPQAWAQSFVVYSGGGAGGNDDENLPNFVDHLALLHGDAGGQLSRELFAGGGLPLKALQFLQFCGVNPVAGALLLRQTGLLELVQMSALEMSIKHSDVLSPSQIVSCQNFLLCGEERRKAGLVWRDTVDDCGLTDNFFFLL